MSAVRHASMATAACVLLSSCLIGGGTRTVTTLELRAAVAGISLGQLDGRVRSAVENGQIWPGATEAELYLSRGQPHLWWNTRLGQNACRVFVHHGADPSIADLAVTTCGGRVIGTNQIQPALPCWRLADVGPRIAAAASYFEERPLDVQWQIVVGLLHRGQAEQDVVIAFGEPHSRGFEEREDGKRAEKLVFLDRSGDAYGLSITLIENKVVGWQMPAERVLTPEAQQRHLAAMEKRLNERIAEVEQLAIRQHAETVRLFSDAMARQDEMLAKLTSPPSAVVVGGGGGVVDSGSPGPSFSSGSEDAARPPPNTPSTSTIADGVCTCKGWPLGTDPKQAKQDHEKCREMTGNDSASCDTMCRAGGYALGLFRSSGSCDGR
ncbi:MAG TPA: hypothetical protein VLB44_18040 [Kofleriaceae bacterium]|nr:hypothetical protein [Kofleriaceae bacterium]